VYPETSEVWENFGSLWSLDIHNIFKENLQMEQQPNIPPSDEAPEIQPVVEEEEPVISQKGRSIKWLIIGGALILFLGVAAFLGARLLKPQSADGLEGEGGRSMILSGGASQRTMRLDMTPAKELPQSKADTTGLFVRRQDQSIFIGTGGIQVAFSSDPNDTGSQSSKYDGPVVEVVITHSTQIYQDLTDLNPDNMDANSDTVKVQQVVKAGSLDDLSANRIISVWGEKQGDRFIAKVILFR
jgi:hypothetical protein